MKKILLLIVAFVLCSQTIKAQVVLDANGVTIKWTGTTIPSPYFVQASPRGTLEWFAVVSNATKSNITNYAKNNPLGITYFTRPGSSSPIPFNNIVTSLMTDMSSMFSGATSFNQNIGSWNVSNVTDMSYMFNGANAFNQNISFWNVSNVTNMGGMFKSASAYNQNISAWNVSNVTDMNQMFWFATAFNQNISSWNVSNVINMFEMFVNTPSFNQPIGSWNVSNVITMNNIFSNAIAFNQPIGSWDVGKVTDMSGMFNNATAFNQNISFWNVSNVITMNNMFKQASSFNQNIGSWNVSNVITMNNMFNSINLSFANYDSILIGWSTITSSEDSLKQGVAFDAGSSKYCNGALARASIISTYGWTITDGGLDCSSLILDTNGVTIKWTGTSVPSPYFVQASPRGTLEWFAIVSDATKGNITNYAKNNPSGITYFTPPGSSTPIPFNNIVTSLMTNMRNMFDVARTFNQPIGSWDVSKVADMSGMFGDASSFNQPIGSWNVGNVTEMISMFRFASSFNQNIGNWNVGNVTSMIGMFDFASSFNQNIGNWNVGNVTSMIGMFAGGAGLSKANYDSLLIGWSTITSAETPLKQGVAFDAGSSKYCNGALARASIISTYGWTITDGGPDCSSLVILDTNGVCIKWNGTSVPSPYFVQASPRGTLEWFAIVSDATKGNITNYAKNNPSGITYFTPPGSSTPIPFNNIVTSLMTDMSSMFENATAFNQPVGSWDVINVINMENMFSQASVFNQPINSWNVSKVTDMRNMFSQDTLFNQDISSWNASKVTDMSGMFFRATSFNQPIGNWNTGKVTDMSYMFYQAPSFNQNIGNWNVGMVTNMSGMFTGVGLYTANYDSILIGWSTITSSEDSLKQGVAFDAGSSKYCNGATARDSIISKYGWTISDGGLDCSNLVILDTNGVTIKWNGTSVPSPYFIQASPRGTLEWFAVVNNSTKSNITDYAQNITTGITYFTPPGSSTPIPFNNIITTLVTNMNGLFFQATTFNQNISSWDVSKVTDMNNMFRGIDSSKFNQNIGSWDVSKVTEMGGMFFQATSFNQNIGSWNVSNVTNMSSMFAFAKLSIANYDSLLIGWSTITSSEDSLKQGVAFDAGSSKYCNGASARASIISNYGWTIKDGGLDCPILGVEELESSKLKIYPIPTNNIINIEGLNKNENNTIQVFDVQGKLVITKTITEKGAIDLSELNKGVYVIKIGEIAQRIVKM